MLTVMIGATLGSGLIMWLLIGAVRRAGIARPLAALTPDAVARAISNEEPRTDIAACWISADGATAIARTDLGLVIAFALGDGLVLRRLSKGALSRAALNGRDLSIPLGDFAAPRARFRLHDDRAAPPWEEVHV